MFIYNYTNLLLLILTITNCPNWSKFLDSRPLPSRMGSQSNHPSRERDAGAYGDQEKVWTIEDIERCTDCRLSSHDCANCGAD